MLFRSRSFCCWPTAKSIKTTHNKRIKISGNNNILYVGKNTLLRDSNIFIKGNNNIIYIGDDCVVNNTSIILDNEGSEIRIGNKTSIAKVQIVSLEPYKIEIGEDCMLSYDIEIRNTDSHKIYDKNTNESSVKNPEFAHTGRD